MDPLLIVLPVGAAIAGAGAGFLLGCRRREPARPQPERAPVGETEDPTAPITPVIEMARSPHDRHRDLEIGRSLIESLDYFDAILESANRRNREDVFSQLALMREHFRDLLRVCSLRSIAFSDGESVDSLARSRIQVVGGTPGDGPARIRRTVRCGYLYEPGDGETPRVVRKAEVELF
jgi:hypothetical protein